MALGSMSRDGSMARAPPSETRSIKGAQSGDGARSKTPPGTPKKSGKLLGVRVQMLDDSVTLFQVQVRVCNLKVFLMDSHQFKLRGQHFSNSQQVD